MLITNGNQHLAVAGGQLTYPERRIGRVVAGPWVTKAVKNTPVVVETPSSLTKLIDKYGAVQGPVNPLFEVVGYGTTQGQGHSYLIAYGDCWSGGEGSVEVNGTQYYIRHCFYGAFGSGSWSGEAPQDPPRHRRPVVHIYQEAADNDQGDHNIWIKVREKWFLFNEAIARRYNGASESSHDLQAWLWFCLLGLVARKEPNDAAYIEVGSQNWSTIASSDRNSFMGFGPYPAQNVKTGNYEWLPFVSD